MTTWYFEDMEVGSRWATAGQTLTLGEIADFATRYDAQALHIDAEWAASGPFRGVIASGFQTLDVAWSLWLRLGVLEGSGRGGIGLDELRWTAPVRPGDTLRCEVEVVDRGATAKRGRGRVVMAHTVRNQRGEVVLTYRALALVASRAPA